MSKPRTVGYEQTDLHDLLYTLEELGQLAAQQPAYLLCYKADASTCHRSLMAARLQKLGLVGELTNLAVKH